MDFERDYILRLIQMMGDLMRRIAELMDDAEQNRLLDQTCRTLCGIPLATAEPLDFESLRDLLAPVQRFTLSELLFAKAESVRRLPYGQRDEFSLKALRLLSSLWEEPRLCDLRARRLMDLKQAVFPSLTADDLLACARFFAQAEAYDKMEDALFQALALRDGAEWLSDAAEGAAMLRRAANATEQALIACGMTSAELRQSAHELETESRKRTGESS